MNGSPEAVMAMQGAVLTRLIIDDSLTLTLRGGGRELTLRIDVAGQIEGPSGSLAFDPDTNPSSLGQFAPLLFHAVQACGLEESGELRFQINGSVVRIPPDPHQVSWSLSTSDGPKASCLAEGYVVCQS